MRNAVVLSLAFHVAALVISMVAVRFTQVHFVPREVYTVQLVEPQITPPVEKPTPKPPVVKPEPPQPEPDPVVADDPDDMVEPDKPKPPKKDKKVTPTVQKKKITTPPPQDPVSDPDPAQDAQPPVETGDMQLSVDDFPFAYYLTSVKRKIAAYWRVPESNAEERFCVMYFRIERSGAISKMSVETSSGNFLFDQAAQRALTQARPLPSLPGSFADDYLGVHFTFAFEREF